MSSYYCQVFSFPTKNCPPFAKIIHLGSILLIFVWQFYSSNSWASIIFSVYFFRREGCPPLAKIIHLGSAGRNSTTQQYDVHYFFRNLTTQLFHSLRRHAYIHTYARTYVHAYVHAYIHTCINTYIHKYIHPIYIYI